MFNDLIQNIIAFKQKPKKSSLVQKETNEHFDSTTKTYTYMDKIIYLHNNFMTLMQKSNDDKPRKMELNGN